MQSINYVVMAKENAVFSLWILRTGSNQLQKIVLVKLNSKLMCISYIFKVILTTLESQECLQNGIYFHTHTSSLSTKALEHRNLWVTPIRGGETHWSSFRQ